MNNFAQVGNPNSTSKHKGKKEKSKTNKWKCYHCMKEEHIKKYYYDYIRKQKQKGNLTITPDKNTNCLAKVLTISNNIVANEWVTDSD